MAADKAVHWQVLEAAQERVRALRLAEIPDAQVYVKRLPTDRGCTLPAVVLSPVLIETEAPGTNIRDDVGYPVQVTIVTVGNQDLDVDERELLWRERIAQAFRGQRLPTVAEVYICRWEPGSIIDPNLFHDENLFVSAFTLRFMSREIRGLRGNS